MRVTHVITRLIIGGAQENTASTVLGLLQKPGCAVNLISGPAGESEGTLEPLFHPHRGTLEILPSLVRPVKPLLDWKAFNELLNIFHETKPDIVHTHSGKAGVVGRLAACKAGVPLIIHSIHGPSFGPFQGALANALFLNAERYAGRKTGHYISVADAMTRQYLQAGIGKPEEYTTIHSGFNLEPFLEARNDPAVRARFNLAPDDFVVGKIARMFELKGHDDLFAAAPGLIRNNPRIKFLLVGGGPWEDRFREMAKSLNLEKHFVFAGLVPPAAVPELVGIMDMLIHLSRREGLPRALPQAMAAGKPVVAFDCDGAGEVCIEERTGFLIPPGDLQRLTRSVIDLSNNSALREKLGNEGREYVRARFSVQQMIDRIYNLYVELRGRKI